MDLPQHPDTGESAKSGPDSDRNWATRIVVGLLTAVVVLVVMLHLTGVVGPGGR